MGLDVIRVILEESELPWNQDNIDTQQPNEFEFLMINVLPKYSLNSLNLAELFAFVQVVLILFDEGDEVFEWFYGQFL